MNKPRYLGISALIWVDEKLNNLILNKTYFNSFIRISDITPLFK
jgi:hypothetical protein